MESGHGRADRFAYGTRSAIITTALAMSMCVASLSLPLYEITYSYEIVRSEGTYVYQSDCVFHLDYLIASDGTYRPYSPTSIMDSFASNMISMILIWLAMGTLYITSCVFGSRAFVRGLLLIACSIAPVVYFAGRIPDAIGEIGTPPLPFVPDDFWGSVSSYSADGSDRTWGPKSGWFLLLLACFIQVAVITRRNAPMLADILSRWKAKRHEESDSE